eukprot:TRINITY_DN13687_c0_g1_i1.p1 TRINITY_DN13687_c0_g1~~TRINITY_DN13687_c0_g1_i1.p1  ORF type:complete len:252 (+),score=69.51 TRINITY_DN13687_c0_g1_i1:114-869(+)
MSYYTQTQDRGGGDYGEADVKREDAWDVIRAYFKEHGLVSQQIKSYNQFLESMVNIILELGKIEIVPQIKYRVTEGMRHKKIIYRFRVTELYKGTLLTTPNDCRIRNLTYDRQVLIRLVQEDVVLNEEGKEESVNTIEYPKPIKLGQLPIMVRSKWCTLHGLKTSDIVDKGECEYDQGGYFVVNGGEKIIVAQEKMTNNFVYVFRKKQPSKYSWVAEIRSYPEGTHQSPITFRVMLAPTYKKENAGPQILC